ncbi:MAG: transposase [Armatimonadota bacterium]
MDFYRNKYDCRILAYVIMPDHYHLVLDLQKPDDLHRWLHDVQMHTGNELRKWLRETATPDDLAIFAKHANGKSKLAIWKEQARAFGIISNEVLRTKIDYMHNNPVKRGLVTDPSQWMWSSWHNYHLDDDSIFRVDRADCF